MVKEFTVLEKIPEPPKPNVPRAILTAFILSIVLTLGYVMFTHKDPATLLSLSLYKDPISSINFPSYSYYIDESVSPLLSGEIRTALEQVIWEGNRRYIEVTADRKQDADIIFTSEFPEDSDLPVDDIETFDIVDTKYLPVASFYAVEDSISLSEVRNKELWAYPNDADMVTTLLEANSISDVVVNEITNDMTLDDILLDSPSRIAFVTPDRLVPTVKLLSLDGGYFLEDHEGVLSLNAIFYAPEGSEIPTQLLRTVPKHLTDYPVSDAPIPEDYFSLRMTGVTAISRNLAIKIERAGDPTYPAQHLAEFLSSADMTHTSNEVSFVPGCVPEQSMRFCSALDYIETLKVSGMDIIELTGNHNNDYGAVYNGSTIEMYDELGWEHFGGGSNIEDAEKILYIDQKDGVVAMVGYNYYDTMLGTGAIAGEDRAGANSYSVEKLQRDIIEAKKNADFVIVDFQFQECYSYPESDVIYPICYKPLQYPDQKAVFKQAIDLGADMVVGTQAHQPQTYEIYKGKLIFYGLGNLYFDQISWIGTRQGLILTHYFLNGVHVQTKIDTTFLGLDMKPYLTYDEDREFFLQLLDDAR